ncbi:MAG TPA: cyclic nucleotide-binding domain-containing protein [Solirubrobacteraceae bacterium]|jgi:CRP-like cAMP-binding protein|nr:cyclic nucleotide-binding domain-containing protein [Solirubrobacteraceae bacterium]
MSAKSDSLRAVPMFSELPEKELRSLTESMQERSYSEGQEVLVEGEGGIGFFVILDGSARVSVGADEVRRLGPGDSFGEMAIIDGQARSASITAGEGLRCAGMTRWHFRPFVRDHPDFAWAIMQALVKRVRDAESR